jgi:hypothetical protein
MLTPGFDLADDHTDRTVAFDGRVKILGIGNGGGFERGFVNHARVMMIDMAGVHAEPAGGRRLGHDGISFVVKRSTFENDSSDW